MILLVILADSRGHCRVVHDGLHFCLQQLPLGGSVGQGSQFVQVIMHVNSHLVAPDMGSGK